MCATVLHPLLPVPPSICSGERLTLVINPQWQPQGQVISGGRQMGSGILNAMAVQRAQNHCRSDCPAFATTQPRALIAPTLLCRLWVWQGAQGGGALRGCV